MAYGGKTLTVYLAADVSKLRNGLNDADRSLSGFGNKLSGMVGPALIGAAAAAGTLAVALAVDGVQAAMAEEAELAKLNTTLDNLGFSWASEQVNTFVDDLQFATGVTDSELRPALERLLVSTGNVAQAQKLLNIAVSTSIGANKSLESVANALGKAYDGNFGALGKLNAGIDASIIKNKDLDGAVAQLANTFGGQAAAQANTLQGQVKILNVAFDELKESLGKGLIEGFTSANGGLGTLSQRMRDLQPETEDLGSKLGILAGNLLDAALGAKTLADKGNELLQGILSYGGVAFEHLGNMALDSLNPISRVVGGLAQVNKMLNPSGGEIEGVKAFGTGGAMARATASLKDAAAAADTASTATTSLAKSSGGASKAVQVMNPRLRAQIDLVKDLTSQLDKASSALVTARKEMNDWIEGMAGQITAGIDLGAAFAAQFDDEGKKTGQSLLQGFNKQIEQAGLFGNYLKRLNSEGGPELRDAVAALGPEAGNKLAKQIIDEGLAKTLNAKLVDVKNMGQTTAAAMTPEFLVAGVNSAVNFLTGTQNALAAATAQLESMGREMGATIGEAAAAEIVAALQAAGIASATATGVVTGTTGVSSTDAYTTASGIIANSPFGAIGSLTATGVAQAIGRSIATSDQRLGRTGQAILQ